MGLWDAIVGTLEEVPGVVRDEAYTAVGEQPIIDDAAADVGRATHDTAITVGQGAGRTLKAAGEAVTGAIDTVGFLGRHLRTILIVGLVVASGVVAWIYGRPLLRAVGIGRG